MEGRASRGVVVAYINTSADVKAEADYCCTSSNAIKVVEQVPAGKEILFLPDMFLGDYVRRRTGRAMHLWVGDCPVHAKLRPEDLERARAEHPGAPVIAHPECGCATQVLPHVDRVLSTDGMVRYAEETRAPEVLVATEVGILHRMRQAQPHHPVRTDRCGGDLPVHEGGQPRGRSGLACG